MAKSSTYPIFVMIAVILLSFGTIASGLPQERLLDTEEPVDCDIEGDEGLYGIGVRLGIYLQVFASMFTLAFQRQQGPAFLYAAAALQAALFVALVYASAHHDIHPAEGFIAILLLILMVLFEFMVFSSIFIHLMSGHVHMANTDTDQDRTTSVFGEGKQESSGVSDSGFVSLSTEKPVHRKGRTSPKFDTENDEVISLRSLPPIETSLTRQKTRLVEQTDTAKLNLREAMYASDPLLIDAENLSLLARVVEIYTNSNTWTSGFLIMLLTLVSWIYMMWFWWTGMYGMRESPCGSHAFFVFATFEIEHWIRWPVRVVLIIVGLGLLSMVYQVFSGFVALCIVLVFQLAEGRTDRHHRMSSTGQKMKHFYDRVSQLGISATTEYLLLIMVFKAYISHWPDRIALGMFRKPTRRQQKIIDKRDQLDQKPKQIVSTDASTKSNAGKPGLALTDEISQIPPEEFFQIEFPLKWCTRWPNGLFTRLLKPRPQPVVTDASAEKAESSIHVLPYADNFATLTLPCLILLSHIGYFLVIGVFLAAGIWSVELTITKNHIRDVNHLPSAAQLIPFIIGAGSFAQSGLSAAGSLAAWTWGCVRMRKGSSSWFDALVARFFYEASAEEGGVDLQHLRRFPLMLVIWMLFPSMRKGQSIYDFKHEFRQQMDKRGGFFALDLLD